jgi:collagenase-like PrtC family protease
MNLAGTGAGSPVSSKSLKMVKEKYKTQLSVEVNSLETASLILDNGPLKNIRNITVNSFNEIFKGSKTGLAKIHSLRKKISGSNTSLVIKTPDVIYDDDIAQFENAFPELDKLGINNFSLSNTGILKTLINCIDGYGKSRGKQNTVNLYLDSQMNVFNASAISFFKSVIKGCPEINIKDITLSAELSLDEIKDITAIEEDMSFSVYSYGYFPVMSARFKLDFLDKDYKKEKYLASNDIKYYYLKDRKGYSFRILSDYSDNLVFLNSRKICNFFDLRQFVSKKICNLFIDTRTFNSIQILEIINYYSTALDLLYVKKYPEFDMLAVRAAKSPLFSEYTRGHFFREVL